MPGEKKTLTLNVIWNSILSLTQILFPLITFPYITRVLGVEANGANSFSLSVVNYFQLFATLGMSTYGVKASAKVKDNKIELSKTVHELMIISVSSTIFVLIALYGSILIIPKFNNNSDLLIIYSFNIALNVLGINWMYQGIEKFKYITTCSVLFKIASIILMFIFVKKPGDLPIYALISVFATNGCNIVNIIYCRRFLIFRKLKRYNLKRHFKPILFLFGTALAVNIYSHMDSVMLGFMHGDYETGIYYVAVKVKTILLTLISSFSIVIMSRLSYISKNNNDDKLNELLRTSYSIIIMFSIPVVAFFIIFSKDSVLFLSGSDYLASSTPMRILMPTITISAVSQIIGNQYSVSVGKEKNLMIAVIFGAVVNLIANAILIPKYSYNGAAIGTLLAEITQCLIQMFFARNMVSQVFSLEHVLKSIGSTVIAGSVVYLISNVLVINSPFIRLLISAVVFFVPFFIAMICFKYDACVIVIEEFERHILKRKSNG